MTARSAVRARIRRVAGCATPTGSAGHAGATANLKLTFHLDHSAGADQQFEAPACPGLSLSLVSARGRFCQSANDLKRLLRSQPLYPVLLADRARRLRRDEARHFFRRDQTLIALLP
jgi:hypothetical protein